MHPNGQNWPVKVAKSATATRGGAGNTAGPATMQKVRPFATGGLLQKAWERGE